MRQKRWLWFVVLALFVAGCATLSNVKPWGDRTPQEKSLAFLQMYNSEFDATMRLSQTANITPAQKEVVKAKKALLSKARPLISAYDGIVTGGGIPGIELEAKILELIDQLAGYGG